MTVAKDEACVDCANNNPEDTVDAPLITESIRVDENSVVPDLRNSLVPDVGDAAVRNVRDAAVRQVAREQREGQWIKFGRYLKARREMLNKTQKEAAEQAGLQTNTWWRLENGKNGPVPETIVKIAEALQEDEAVVFQEANFKISELATDDAHESKQIGGRIRNWRKYRDLPPQSVAAEAGTSLNEYLLLEAGRKPLTAVQLRKIADALNVPTNDLLHGGSVSPPKVGTTPGDARPDPATRPDLQQLQETISSELRSLKEEVRSLKEVILRGAGGPAGSDSTA